MTTKEVHEAVRTFFWNYDYKLLNCYIFNWESDFFAISKSDYSVEVEVKVSRADFKKDFTHKTDKHNMFKRHKEIAFCKKGYESREKYFLFNGEFIHPMSTSVYWYEPCKLLPNKFYYACDKGLILPNEVPSYAGLLYTDGISSCDVVKPAPFLHKNKRDFSKILLSKYYYKHGEIKMMLNDFIRFQNLTEEQEKVIRQIMNRTC